MRKKKIEPEVLQVLVHRWSTIAKSHEDAADEIIGEDFSDAKSMHALEAEVYRKCAQALMDAMPK
jgi:hypothetical protein